jgi:hypothetical protein
VLCCAPFLSIQARAVIDGLPADLVALALPLDVQKIADAGLLRQDWKKMYPLQSVGGWHYWALLGRVDVSWDACWLARNTNCASGVGKETHTVASWVGNGTCIVASYDTPLLRVVHYGLWEHVGLCL